MPNRAPMHDFGKKETAMEADCRTGGRIAIAAQALRASLRKRLYEPVSWEQKHPD
jgi:hypothetical protein